MSDDLTLQPVPSDRWCALACTCLDYNYQHAWGYVRALAHRNRADVEHVAVMSGDAVIGLAAVRIRTVPILGAGIAYVRGGPLVRFKSNSMPTWSRCLQQCLQALIAEYAERRALTLRIIPPLGATAWNREQERVFARAGFILPASAIPYRTMVVDLTGPPARIRAAFRQKWRNGLNRSERAGLTIRAGAAVELFDRFVELHDELREQKSFDVRLDASFYRTVHRELDEDDRFRITLAERDGRPVAGHVASLLGDTCVFLLGAANAVGRQTRASYLLQWDALLAARDRGCRVYDLGGIDPHGNPGVYHFKHGLAGAEIVAPGPFDLRPRGPKQLIVSGAEQIIARARRACRT